MLVGRSSSARREGQVQSSDRTHLFGVDLPMPRSSATCCRESPLVSVIRTASLRNSSVLLVPMSHLLCCTLRYQRSGTKPQQVQDVAGPLRSAVAGGRWLAHGARLTAWIHDVNPRPAEFCNNASAVVSWNLRDLNGAAKL